MLSWLLPQEADYTDGVIAGGKVYRSVCITNHGKSLQFLRGEDNSVLALAGSDFGANVQWLMPISLGLPSST